MMAELPQWQKIMLEALKLSEYERKQLILTLTASMLGPIARADAIKMAADV